MTIENSIRIIAGAMVLVSAALTKLVNINWIWLTVFVGANLVQSAFTGFCPAEKIITKLFFKKGV